MTNGQESPNFSAVILPHRLPGRKRLTDNPEFRDRLIALLQDPNKSYPQIAAEMRCSTGVVEKFVRENRNSSTDQAA